MSMRTLIIWCIIAGFLGGGALILRQQHTERVRTQPVEWASLQFDPASIITIRMGVPDQGVRIERHPERIDEWTGTWTTIAGDQSWRVSANRVRGAIRTFATVRVRLSDERLVDSGSEIVLGSRDGAALSVLVGQDRSGGRAPIRVEQRDESGAIERVLDGWIESTMIDAFDANQTLAWRDPKLMDFALPSVQRVRVRAGEHMTEAQLVGSRWMLTTPFFLHADRERVETLIRTMSSMQASSFVDSIPDESTTGLASPIAEIEIETGDATYAITLGQQADLSAETLYAKFTRADQSTIITVPIASLSKLTAYPDAYIASIANPTPQTSISAVRVLGREGRVRFESVRNLGEWSQGGTRVDTLTSDSITRLITLITQTKANAVRVLSNDLDLPREIAGVVLVNASGQELGSYLIAMEQSDQGIRLLVAQDLENDQRVVWAYLGEDAQATATWLTLTAGRPIPSN
jgi:hypothetical protein